MAEVPGNIKLQELKQNLTEIKEIYEHNFTGNNKVYIDNVSNSQITINKSNQNNINGAGNFVMQDVNKIENTTITINAGYEPKTKTIEEKIKKEYTNFNKE